MSLRGFMSGAALAMTLGMGACAPAMKQQGEDVERYSEKAVLTVENNNWQDMTLYVLRDGTRIRLGSVTALSRAKFTLPSAAYAGTGELRIMADPLGSTQAWTSQPIHVMPGQELRFRLENNVQLSSYSVY